MALKITILFDNYVNPEQRNRGLKPMWGFAAFVETEQHKILFDSGSNGWVLLHNARVLGVDLKQAQYFFLSHPHWDHIGGWDTVLEVNPDIRFVWPMSVSKHLLDDIASMAKLTVTDDRPVEFAPHLFSTGVMQPEGEQALIIDTPSGLVIIAGCSHPRIENFIARAKQMFPTREILYVIGGFHLLHDSKEHILQALERFDTRYITPTHCTGALATELIRQRFGELYIPGGVGQEIEFKGFSKL